MSSIFRFKYFDVLQEANSHKLGTDSLLLGAWTERSANRILDIGTGTGVLALMMAQKNPSAQITAIEPIPEFLEEARTNFQNSPYSNRLLAIQSDLQGFGSLEKFDLIITNPPYFDSTYHGPDDQRNSARHDSSLEPFELFECAEQLLHENGILSLIIPFDREEEYLYAGHRENLHPQNVLRTIRPKGGYKRSLIQFSFERKQPEIAEIRVKDHLNSYSDEYIHLTKEFHGVSLQ